MACLCIGPCKCTCVPTAPICGHNIPQTLTLTDDVGTCTLTYCSSTNTWDGSYATGGTLVGYRMSPGSAALCGSCTPFLEVATLYCAVGCVAGCTTTSWAGSTNYCGTPINPTNSCDDCQIPIKPAPPVGNKTGATCCESACMTVVSYSPVNFTVHGLIPACPGALSFPTGNVVVT